ncbi:MAG: thrombospondin type 3 repeat-containing protein [Saprospiraceae bacterium]|nr:thrombospondin type 3 repeat-containing protein [Saprospiraceae bacterium]
MDELLLLLEKEGFALDTKRRVRLLRALEKHGDRFLDPAEFQNLKYLIAPFVVRSEREQAKFYVVFEAFRKECEQEWLQWEKRYENINSGAPKSPVIPPSPTRWKRYRWAFLLVAVVAALLVLCKMFCPPPPQPQIAFAVKNLQIGEDTLLVENRSTGIDSSLFRWRVFDAETGREEYKDSTSYHLAWPVTGAGSRKTFELSARHPEAGLLADSFTTVIFCSNPPAVGEIIGPTDSLLTGRPYIYRLSSHEPGSRVEWYTPGNDTLRGEQVRITFSASGDQFVLARVYRPGEETRCYTDRTLSVGIGADKPYLALLPLYEDEPRTIYRLRTWVWLLLLIPLLAGSWFLRRWWRRRNEKPVQKTTAELEREYAVLDEGPYHIPYPAQEHKISVPRDFFRIAEVLHRREDSLRRSLDLPASVRATIDNAGFPVLRERPDSLPAAYLFLLERRDPRDQQGLLFARLAAFLRRRDVPAVFFEHDGHFDRLRNADHPEGLNLTELQRRYPGCRLVLVGNAHHLVQTPADQSPTLNARLVADFARWPRRLLLTPEPPVAWAFQEKLLHQAFLLYPADTDGMLEGLLTLDRTEEYLPGPFDRHRTTLRVLRNEANPRFNTWQTPADHRLYLSDDTDAYRWLRALAVNAQPDWALTLAVGRAIGVEVTHDRLLRLTRIPWLSANQTDDHLRLAFLRELDPADEKNAREAVAETLREVPDWVQKGFANTERRVNLAVQEFALAPRDDTRRQTLRELRAVGLLDGSHRAELDQKVRQEISGNELPPGTPHDLAGVLSVPAPRRFFTRDLIWALTLLGFGVLLLGLALWFRVTPIPPLGSAPMYRAEKPYDRAVDLNNSAVQMYRKVVEQRDYLSWYNLSASALTADSLFQRAMQERRPEMYPLADSNLFALRYDQAVRRFNFFLDRSAGGITIGRENIAQQAQQSSRDTNETPIAPMRSLLQDLGAAFAGLVGDSVRADDARRLNALHGKGLCDFYQEDTVAARAVLARIVAAQPGYFDTLGMRVNLRTLLGNITSTAEPQPLVLSGRVLDSLTNRPIRGALVLAADANRITYKKLEETKPGLWKKMGIYADTTDSEGRYTFGFPEEEKIAQLQMLVLAGGYKPKAARARFKSPLPSFRLSKPEPAGIPGEKPCCERLRDRGEIATMKGDYVSALKYLEQAKNCPDSKKCYDLEVLIKKAEARRGAMQRPPPEIDSDGDGVPDKEDKCPKEPGPRSNGGCPEKSKDGTAASDRDDDGIPDIDDECPSAYGPSSTRGCPDADGDGIPDNDDRCPTEKGTKENNGCPGKG